MQYTGEKDSTTLLTNKDTVKPQLDAPQLELITVTS